MEGGAGGARGPREFQSVAEALASVGGVSADVYLVVGAARAREGGAGGSRGLEEFKSIVELVASVVGLAAYVYLVGGIVLWARLTAADLPADTATIVADPKRLFLIGLRSLLLVTVIL